MTFCSFRISNSSPFHKEGDSEESWYSGGHEEQMLFIAMESTSLIFLEELLLHGRLV